MDTVVSDGVLSFFKEFYFPKDSKNTRRLYQTAISKFNIFLSEIFKLPAQKISISELPSSIIPTYLSWLDKNHMAEHTVRIYSVAARRLLKYWRVKGWLHFSLEEEEENTSAMSIHTKRDRSILQSPRVARVPDDFGERMVQATDALVISKGASHMEKLNILRARALINFLMATGLRVGDVCRLTKNELQQMEVQGGYFSFRMEKTGGMAHCFLQPHVLAIMRTYLEERADESPWLFIQHGRSGNQRKGTSAFFRSARRGYGAHISTKTAWVIVHQIGKSVYTSPQAFLSPHAFRHWHAQSLIRAGARLEDVQSVLGHANPTITKQIYAPEPDLQRIAEKEKLIQRKSE
jgi:site-specific recombinase XerD